MNGIEALLSVIDNDVVEFKNIVQPQLQDTYKQAKDEKMQELSSQFKEIAFDSLRK